MDDKSIEKLYNSVKTEETPDLWKRIEDALPEKTQVSDETQAFDSRLESKLVKESKITDISKKKAMHRHWIKWCALAAACLVVIVGPLSLMTTKLGRSAGSTEMAAENSGQQYAADVDAGGLNTGMGADAKSGRSLDMAAAEAEGGAVNQELASDVTKTTENVADGRKLIKTVDMMMETLAFDTFMSELQEVVSQYGGYFETSSIEGGNYEFSTLKYGYFTIRIPENQLDAFVENVGCFGNVIRKSEQTQDITLEYTDTESHIKALEIQQEKLMDLMAKAKDMEEILQIETKLSNIQYEIEYYQTMKNKYDDMVGYSTVNIDVNEVEKETPKEAVSIGDKIKQGWKNTCEDIGTGFQDLLVWLIINLPYILIVAGIFTAAALIGRKIYKVVKRRNRN